MSRNNRFGFGRENDEWDVDLDPRREEQEDEALMLFNSKKKDNKKSESEPKKSALLVLGKELVEMKQIFNEVITELQAIHTDISPDILKAVKKHYLDEKSKLVKKIIREIVNNLM